MGIEPIKRLNLDFDSRKIICDSCQKLKDCYKLTIGIVTHDMCYGCLVLLTVKRIALGTIRELQEEDHGKF